MSEAEVARASMHRQARAARELLAPFSPSGRSGLQAEVVVLPATHDVLLDALLGPATPEVTRLANAAATRPTDSVASFVAGMLGRVDTAAARTGLGQAIAALRAQGAIDEHLAAAALVDLDEPASALLAATAQTAVRAELASHALAASANVPPARSGRPSDFVTHG